MAKIRVYLPSRPAASYPVLLKPGLLDQVKDWISDKINTADVVMITDHTVKKLYGRQLARSLKQTGRRVLLLSIPAGEHSKNAEIKQSLENQMQKHGYGRETVCLALGGGVVGDLAGFIAATYMRGISLIQIPTSLLAMIDSSVGGKTAINTAYGKNLIGAFWQPIAVVADVRCLRSLPKNQLINGLIEAVKIFLTHDRRSFAYLQKNLARCLAQEEKILQNMIERAIKIKAAVVAVDEREHSGARQTLNFGHTIGHALERVSDYKLLHGYAVAYGILVEAKIAELMGILAPDDYQEIVVLLEKLAIFPQDLAHYSHKAIIQATRYDKKNKAGKVHYVLLKTIGQIEQKNFTHPVSDKIVARALQQLQEMNYAGK